MSANMRLEPGIKALVIGYNSNPYNLGKVVTLISFHKKGDLVPWCGDKSLRCNDDLWLAEGEDLLKMSISSVTGALTEAKGTTGIFRSDQLMPIRPEEDPLEVTDKIKQEIEA